MTKRLETDQAVDISWEQTIMGNSGWRDEFWTQVMTALRSWFRPWNMQVFPGRVFLPRNLPGVLSAGLGHCSRFCLRCPSDCKIDELEEMGVIMTPNESDHDMLIGLFHPVTEMSAFLRLIKNKVDDQKKSCKSRIR
jgi:hypothetical protein